MSNNTIQLGRYVAKIIPDADYDYLDEVIKGKDILKMDFSHVTDWVDQKTLSIELNLWNQIPVMYNYDVLKSLTDFQEESPYAGLDPHGQMKVYKRLKIKYNEDQRREDEYAKPLDDIGDPSIRVKLTRLREKVFETTFDRGLAARYVEEYLEFRGNGIMRARVPEIARLICDWKRI